MYTYIHTYIHIYICIYIYIYTHILTFIDGWMRGLKTALAEEGGMLVTSACKQELPRD